MSATYLQMVNDVLVRLRAQQVASVNDTDYAKLIGKFVNDAKRQVEDAFDWNVLRQTVVVTTAPGVSSYSLVGSGQKFRELGVINTYGGFPMWNLPYQTMQEYLNSGGVPPQALPTYYTYNGYDVNYDTKIDLYPVPDAAYTLRFNLVIPQAMLASDSTVILVPEEIVQQNAFARAIVERGEDGGLNSSEAYQLYRTMLSDYIALESTRYPENSIFVSV
jgi:hypothetical protein